MKIKNSELRQKSSEELELMVKNDQEKLRELQFDLASKKLKNTNLVEETKRQIAKILTILKERKQTK